VPLDERPFDVRWEQRDDGVIVIAGGEIDLWSAPEVRAALEPHQSGGVVLDLREVTFMDSSGVAAVDRARRDAPDAALTVCSELHRNVRQILELTGVQDVLTFEPCDGES